MGYQKNIIYEKVLIPANKTDGESPTTLELTQETNCFALWFNEPVDNGTFLVKAFNLYEKDEAIEYAVELGKLPIDDSLIIDDWLHDWSLQKL